MKSPKELIRCEYLNKRRTISSEMTKIYSHKIMAYLLTLVEIKKVKVIFAYMSFRNEVSCEDVFTFAKENDLAYAVPKVVKNHQLQFYVIRNESDLELSPMGILEPKDTCEPIMPLAGDVVIVPGLAFAKTGYRIGYGGGYYDRLMVKYKEATYIGVCYVDQLISVLPVQEHDQKVEKLITQLGIIDT